MDTNLVVLTGNLTRDVELRTTTTGKVVAKFSLATNRVFKGATGDQKKDTVFTKIEAWANLANTCSKFLKKGSKVLVEGRLADDSYESEPGKKVRGSKVVADKVQFLTPKSQSGDHSNIPADNEPF